MDLYERIDDILLRIAWLRNSSLIRPEDCAFPDEGDLETYSSFQRRRYAIPRAERKGIERLVDAYDATLETLERQRDGHPVYRQALEAKRAGDVEELTLLLQTIFRGLTHATAPRMLYHGVAPRPSRLDFEDVRRVLSPAAYVDRVLQVQRQGLVPSEGMHVASDNNFCPVFFVEHHAETYGMLFLAVPSVELQGPLFKCANAAGEIMAYSDCVKAPFRICLKSEEFGDRLDGQGSQRKGMAAYRGKVQAELDRRGVEYALFDPEGARRK
jgi:hypothetical protein